MQPDTIHIGERYVVIQDGKQTTVKVVARCEGAIHSWRCERDDKTILIVSVEAFQRPAEGK